MANARTPHKHAEVIRAYADGATIEYFDDGHEVWYVIDNPSFHTSMKYRIKPEPKTHKYRVALFSCEDKVFTHAEDEQDGGILEGYSDFVRYITDWIEVEV